MKKVIYGIAITDCILFVVACFLLCSCMTDKKVAQYNREHPEQHAKGCAETFPVKESTVIVTDTLYAENEETVNSLLTYADSVSQIAEERNKAIQSVNDLLQKSENEKNYSEAIVNELQTKIKNIPSINIEALKKSIEAKVRAEIKPAVNTSAVTTKRDIAQETVYKNERDKAQGEADKYHKKFDNWKKIALIAMGMNLLAGIWIFRKPLLALL